MAGRETAFMIRGDSVLQGAAWKLALREEALRGPPWAAWGATGP